MNRPSPSLFSPLRKIIANVFVYVFKVVCDLRAQETRLEIALCAKDVDLQSEATLAAGKTYFNPKLDSDFGLVLRAKPAYIHL